MCVVPPMAEPHLCPTVPSAPTGVPVPRGWGGSLVPTLPQAVQEHLGFSGTPAHPGGVPAVGTRPPRGGRAPELLFPGETPPRPGVSPPQQGLGLTPGLWGGGLPQAPPAMCAGTGGGTGAAAAHCSMSQRNFPQAASQRGTLTPSHSPSRSLSHSPSPCPSCSPSHSPSHFPSRSLFPLPIPLPVPPPHLVPCPPCPSHS